MKIDFAIFQSKNGESLFVKIYFEGCFFPLECVFYAVYYSIEIDCFAEL